MYNKFDDIKIIGGGSAGWMTATTLIRKCKKGTKITLIESPNISTVGVGESTIIGISDWLESINLNDPKKFLKEVDGTIKLSIRFEDFYKKDAGGFHYPFSTPLEEDPSHGVTGWYYKKILNPNTPVSDFADVNYPIMALVNNNKLTSENFYTFNYKRNKAYHFDATKFGLFLKESICIPEGVNHILSDVVTVNKTEDGYVENVVLENGEKVSADLWIDCTGFKSLLLSETLEEEFLDFSKLLPNNKAWATRIPYKNKKEEICNYTDCIAQNNGWVWKIPLWSRWGSGYVYSDKYISDEDALKEFKEFIKKKDYSGVPIEDLEFRNIKMRVGRHKRLWVKNVVAIGLSAGFIEPLESNGLFTVHEFLRMLIKKIDSPRDRYSEWDRLEFNNEATRLFDGFASFVAAHYALSHRDDTPYWVDIQSKDWVSIHKNLGENMQGRYFEDIMHHKITATSWDPKDGLTCIAPGFNWMIQDFNKLSFNAGSSDIETYRNDILKMISFLEQRKEGWEKEAKPFKNTYDFLNDNFYKQGHN